MVFYLSAKFLADSLAPALERKLPSSALPALPLPAVGDPSAVIPSRVPDLPSLVFLALPVARPLPPLLRVVPPVYPLCDL